jgi:Tfp pilus assembly protein PilN
VPKLNLQPREKTVVGLGAAAVALMAVWWASQGPYQAYQASWTQLDAAKSRLLEAKVRVAEIEQARRKEKEVLDALAEQGPTFDLWTHVDRVIKEMNLGSRSDMRSRRGVTAADQNMTAIELSLTGLSTRELVDLLHRIYNNDYVIILDRLDHLKPSQAGKGLDCRMVLVSPRA